ncbi:MAG TPA: hypothetical protein V6D25_17385 [Leptolyngbyaceae cyanobacterium]
MKRIVFCDFDGTITVEETFVAVLKKFAPELSAQLLPEMYAKRLTQQRSYIPWNDFLEIRDYLAQSWS